MTWQLLSGGCKITGNSSPHLSIPQHVAIIMDGNGRWAAQHGLPRIEGHRRGVANAKNVVSVCAALGVKYLTLYAFSTENWKRPPAEVLGLFDILAGVIDEAIEFGRVERVRFRAIGRVEGLPLHLQEVIKRAMEATRDFDRIHVNVCLNYGARDEILMAVRKILMDRVPLEEITEARFSQNLYTRDVPEPDLIIRTGGEQRLSNFLLWQAAYTELYFTDVLWPDFDEVELRRALDDYQHRQRRFGAVPGVIG
ncbi:MAG: polyprenyl diphosphate synthase [Dehalococcoidia bacterium]|nr:polyprenyl diphosphate synthase [Dehalococcoidia bacterium]